MIDAERKKCYNAFEEVKNVKLRSEAVAQLLSR